MKKISIILIAFCLIAGTPVYADVIDSRSATSDDTTQIYGGTSGTYEMMAQKITVSAEYDANSATVQLKKVGTPTDNVIYDIYTDAGGSPGGSMGVSASLAGSSLGTSCSDVQISFASPVDIPAGTYWLVIARDGMRDTGNYPMVCDTYPSGTDWKIYNNPTWDYANPGVNNGALIFAVEGDLVGGGGGGGGGGTTTVASTTTIDNPSQNVFNGFILFFMTLIMAVWLHKKQR